MLQQRLGLTVAALLSVAPIWGQQNTTDLMTKRLAPFVSAPVAIAERMLEVARLKPGETLFDLGSGEGRILLAAAGKFGAKAVGVELSEALARKAVAEAQAQGLQDSIKVIRDDMMAVDVSSANVVALYLLTEANEQLRPKLERELKTGSRVVSLEFKIKGWKPVKVEQFEAHHHRYTIYLYEVNARK